MTCEASAWLKDFSATNRIVLGSGSRTRRLVLEVAGVKLHSVISPDIDEKAIRAPTPQEMTTLIARAKAQAVIDRLEDDADHPTFIVCSDMVAVFRGQVREKPESPAQAEDYLLSYSQGEPVGLVASVVVINTMNGKKAEKVHECSVLYRPFTTSLIQEIVNDTIIYAACGGVSIDGKGFDENVVSYEGGWDGVMGLPVATVEELIKAVI
jgi:septum formation protein